MPRMTTLKEDRREAIENALLGLRHARDDLEIVKIQVRQKGEVNREHLHHIEQQLISAERTLAQIWREDWKTKLPGGNQGE